MIDLGNNNNSRYFSVSDDASLSLPNADWCVGIWTRVEDNAGSFFQYALSNNTVIANSFNLFIAEASQATIPNKWQCAFLDGSSNRVDLVSSNSPGADSVTRLLIVQRNGSNAQLYSCAVGASAFQMATASIGSVGVINGGAWNIGRRTDGNTDRYFEEHLGGWFKGDFSLSTDEIEAIAQGITPMELGKTCDVYIPFTENVATAVDIAGSNDATRNGTGLATAEHYPMFATAGIVFVRGQPAAAGNAMPMAMNHYRRRRMAA